MARGGKREGSGGRPTWNYGKTKPVRVPVALAEKILEIARVLDEQGFEAVSTEVVGGQKVIDLSGIAIRYIKDGPAVYLADLINAGYEIKPPQLMKQKRESSLSSLKKLVNEGIEQLRQLEGEE